MKDLSKPLQIQQCYLVLEVIVQRSIMGVSPIVKTTLKWNGVIARRNGHSYPINHGVDQEKWWLGRAQRFWRKYNFKWGHEEVLVIL